ncbi:uncharacterized protein LOC119447664 [Dermacentor silvarum]|uniref:uncharacterized protein LOC119447664 n=1 Tax=Dermacentor silvarum TaxID=543639 RepID=UPI00210137BA|nr:uncharacterized protein LOC119447664 [Dermacentor silvarum]
MGSGLAEASAYRCMRAPFARSNLGRLNPQTALVPAGIHPLPLCTSKAILEFCEQSRPSEILHPFELQSSSDDDGINFVMPSRGPLYDKVISGEPLTSSFRQIIDILFSAMAKTTLFPTRHFYSKVTSLLLEKYPQLRDVVGSGSHSWKVALRNKFKNQRRKLQDDRVLHNRSKFGAQRKAAASELQEQEAKGASEMAPARLRTRHILALAVLDVLASNVKERAALGTLFVPENDDIPATPCVAFTGDTVQNAQFLFLLVDREKCFSVMNAEEGLAAIMCAYWLFNLLYDCKVFNTLVLERFFVGLDLTTPRSVVTKFLNRVVKASNAQNFS